MNVQGFSLNPNVGQLQSVGTTSRTMSRGGPTFQQGLTGRSLGSTMQRGAQSVDFQTMAASPLDTMAAQNMGPTFITPVINENGVGVETRKDDVMGLLLTHGYIVKNRLYMDDQLKSFVATTQRGDPIIITVDNAEYASSFPSVSPSSLFSANDVQMERRSSLTLVPQETKIGTLKCLDYGICGAAFICNGTVCMTRKDTGLEDQLRFIEENFLVSGGNISSSVSAIPVVLLSEVLAHPEEVEAKVAKVSSEINKLSFRSLQDSQKQLHDSVDKLHKEVKTLGSLSKKVEHNLDKEISVLTQNYKRTQSVNIAQLPADLQEAYYANLSRLDESKELRSDYVTALSSTNNAVRMIDEVAQYLNTVTAPIINKLVEAGVIKV